MQRLEKLGRLANQLLAWVAGISLCAMLAFTVADMALRALGRPIAGSYEMIGWLSACAMALSLGYVQQYRGHVAVNLLEEAFAPRVRAVVELLTSVLSLALFAAVAWFVGRYGITLQETGSLSETLRVIVYPWVYVVAIGCAGLALSLLVDFLRAAIKLARPAPRT